MISKKATKNKFQKITIYKNELRQLLHWARFGIRFAHGGSYQTSICRTIHELSKKVETVKEAFEWGEYIK